MERWKIFALRYFYPVLFMFKIIKTNSGKEIRQSPLNLE